MSSRDDMLVLLDALEVGVVVLDAAENVLAWNRWLSARSGIESRAAVGQRLAEVLPEMAGTRLQQAVDYALRQQLPSVLSPALHGTILRLYQSPGDHLQDTRMKQLIHVVPIKGGQEGGAACMIQVSDMTAAVTRERVLRQQADTLRRKSSQDPLTHLANRRCFDETLATTFKLAQGAERTVALVIADIDCFDAYNAHYGRQIGDSCLQEIAAALRAVNLQGTDLLARYGGEEFAFILPGMDERTACEFAENIRLRIGTLAIPNAPGNPAGSLTVSVGVAVMKPDPSADTHTLISSVDVALYQAKHEGRNKAIYFSMEEGSFKNCT